MFIRKDLAMGEIKSTLDLVMEKTKHLILSEDEKVDQRRKEIGQKIKGLIKKYQDGVLTMDRFENELQSIQNDYKIGYRSMVTQDIINRFDISGYLPDKRVKSTGIFTHRRVQAEYIIPALFGDFIRSCGVHQERDFVLLGNF